VARRAKLQLKHVREVRSAPRTVASLDRTATEDGDASFGDLVATAHGSVEEEIVVGLGVDALRRAVDRLPEIERDIIKRRYGLDGDPDPQALEEIGRGLGMSRERVRQIESRALERLAEEREIAA